MINEYTLSQYFSSKTEICCMSNHSHRGSSFSLTCFDFSQKSLNAFTVYKTTYEKLSCQFFELIHRGANTSHKRPTFHARVDNIKIAPWITKIDNYQIYISDLQYFFRVIPCQGYKFSHS